MIEIRCPRCGQYWYDNDEKEGRARLCSRCADHLRLKRERRGLIDLPFLIVAGMLFWTDLSLIALSALLPALFAKVMLVCGGLQLLGGMIGLSFLGFSKEEGRAAYLSSFTYDTDWKIGRWLLLIAISGMVCLLAAGAFLGFKSKSQKSRSEIGIPSRSQSALNLTNPTKQYVLPSDSMPARTTYAECGRRD